MLKLKGVHFTYNTGIQEIKALKDINLQINEKDFLVLMGGIGSGKSTLLQVMNGILKPQKGRFFFQEEEVKSEKLRSLRKKIGLLFQYPEHQLFAETVEEDVAFAPKNLGFSKEEITACVQEALELVGLPAAVYKERSPFSLSGGEQRKAALAGVLAFKPELLLLDEPISGMDPDSTKAILNLLDKLNTVKGTTIVIVSHEIDKMLDYANRFMVLSEGRVLMDGCPSDILTESKLLRTMNLEPPLGRRILDRLHDRGIQVCQKSYRLEDVEEEIARLFSGRDAPCLEE